MISRRSESQLLRPTDVQASDDRFTVIGVFNPGVVRIDNWLFMLVRVAEKPREQRVGFQGLPRWDADKNCVIDWVRDEELISIDPRVVRSKSDHMLRLTSVSHLRVLRTRDGRSDGWSQVATLLPQMAWEEFGMEDARITKIEQAYWISYVAVSRLGAATALAASEDMLGFKRHGLIFHSENKDVVLFPEKINGQYIALHRPNPNSHFSPPQIWIARSPDLLHWGEHKGLHRGKRSWEADRIGGGTPPILIAAGWLHLYHGSRRAQRHGRVGEYSVGALLLDRDHPDRVLAQSREPIMRPTSEFERNGFVPNVVFPTAMIPSGVDETKAVLSVYYGAADTSIGVVEFLLQDVLNTLE